MAPSPRGDGTSDRREGELLRVLVDLAEPGLEPPGGGGVLDRLTAHCARLFDVGATALLLTGPGDGDLTTELSAAHPASIGTPELGDHLEPALDCFRAGATVALPDLAGSGDRWPDWADRHVAQGYRSAHVVPMRLRGEVIGALTVLRRTPGPMSGGDQHAVRAFADIATITLITHARTDHDTAVAAELRATLAARVVLEQAKGVIAGTLGVSVDEAHEVLLADARHTEALVSDVARAVGAKKTAVRDLVRPDHPTRHLHTASTGAVVIDQAAAAVAAETDLTPGEALRLLRVQARTAGVGVIDLANAVMAGRLGPEDLLWSRRADELGPGGPTTPA